MNRPSEGESKIIWKYRGWADANARLMIESNQIYFSSARNFNDQFEFASNFDLEGANEVNLTMQDEFIVAGMNAVPNVDLTDPMAGRPKRLVPRITFELGLRNSMMRDFSVFCGSRRNDNDFMWRNYADEHRGFCVGFYHDSLVAHLNSLPKEHFESQAVEYRDEPPVTYPNQAGTMRDAIRKYLFTKSLKWKFEEETRIVRFGDSGCVVIPDCYIAGIVLGSRLPPEGADRIRTIYSRKYSVIPLYQATIPRTGIVAIRPA